MICQQTLGDKVNEGQNWQIKSRKQLSHPPWFCIYLNICRCLSELLVSRRGQNKESSWALPKHNRKIVQEWRFAPLIAEIMTRDDVQTASRLFAGAQRHAHCWANCCQCDVVCTADWLNMNRCWFGRRDVFVWNCSWIDSSCGAVSVGRGLLAGV